MPVGKSLDADERTRNLLFAINDPMIDKSLHLIDLDTVVFAPPTR